MQQRNRAKVLVNLIYDKEYKGYVAEAPQLPGCMSQGKTAELALKNARRAIQLYLREAGARRLRDTPEVITSQIEVSL
jgi:predicted RNase H-like HicB family nuclease